MTRRSSLLPSAKKRGPAAASALTAGRHFLRTSPQATITARSARRRGSGGSPGRSPAADRELYLPRSWTDDRDRCQQAGIPGGVEFISKPRQAQAMISRAIQGGVPFGWFTGDEVYGQAKWLQAWLEENGVS